MPKSCLILRWIQGAIPQLRRSRWPRSLGLELSSLARTLGSWVRIPLKAWMSVGVYSVFVLFCVRVAAMRRADHPSKESCRLCIGLRNWKGGQGPTKDCGAIDRYHKLRYPTKLGTLTPNSTHIQSEKWQQKCIFFQPYKYSSTYGCW
jgi:hypothetical protein